MGSYVIESIEKVNFSSNNKMFIEEIDVRSYSGEKVNLIRDSPYHPNELINMDIEEEEDEKD